MQNAQFGPTMLGNDFKLYNHVLLGINSVMDYSISSVLNKFEDAGKISFEGVLLDQLREIATEPQIVNAAEQDYSEAELLLKKAELEGYFADKNLKFNLCRNCSTEPAYLRDQSALFDLFFVGSEVLKKENRQLLKFIYELNCPVLIIPREFIVPEHILFVFDGTPESVVGMKKFIQLFSDKLIDTTVTCLMVNDSVKNERGFNEKVIVKYLLSNFIDVGIVTTTCHALDKEIRRLSSQYQGTMILSGLIGMRTFISRKLCNLIVSNNIPVFFSH